MFCVAYLMRNCEEAVTDVTHTGVLQHRAQEWQTYSDSRILSPQPLPPYSFTQQMFYFPTSLSDGSPGEVWSEGWLSGVWRGCKQPSLSPRTVAHFRRPPHSWAPGSHSPRLQPLWLQSTLSGTFKAVQLTLLRLLHILPNYSTKCVPTLPPIFYCSQQNWV